MNQSQGIAPGQASQHQGAKPVDPGATTYPTQTSSGAPVGEGSYEGTAGYAARVQNYLASADVEADAIAAAPQTPREADELRDAEQAAAARSLAKGA